MGKESIIDRTTFDRQAILLVEDNEDDVLIMQSAFRKAGVPNPLKFVGDGEQAIAYLKGEGAYIDRQQYPLPVVILLDLNMPRKNGFEVLQWLRQQPSLRRITVNILTASSRPEDVERAFDLGANVYLIKPGRFEALVEMVRAWHTFSQFKAFPAN
jgi:CheY-like chemotaxis protein